MVFLHIAPFIRFINLYILLQHLSHLVHVLGSDLDKSAGRSACGVFIKLIKSLHKRVGERRGLVRILYDRHNIEIARITVVVYPHFLPDGILARKEPVCRRTSKSNLIRTKRQLFLSVHNLDAHHLLHIIVNHQKRTPHCFIRVWAEFQIASANHHP